MMMDRKESRGGVKKFVIKPLRSRTSLPEDFRDANWRQLCEAIDAIKKEVPVSTSLEQLYRSVEDVCVQGHAEWLYAQLQERCQGHASSVLSSLSEVVQGYQEQMGDTAYSEQMLDQVGGLWDVYCSQLMLIRHIFLYLDRTHLLMKSEHRSVFEMGLRYFKEYMNTEYVQVKKMVLQGIMGAVDAERRGDAVRRDVLKNLVRMFALLGLYEDSLMPLFLERARAFYAEEGNRIILVRLVLCFIVSLTSLCPFEFFHVCVHHVSCAGCVTQ